MVSTTTESAEGRLCASTVSKDIKQKYASSYLQTNWTIRAKEKQQQ